jgi:hypothetical protein
MNRARKKINWKFDRKAASLKFRYKRNSSERSRTSRAQNFHGAVADEIWAGSIRSPGRSCEGIVS